MSVELEFRELKVVRIRQRDCKSRPLGSGSSPPGPTYNALLVQWIEHLTTDQEIGVRISYGVHKP